MEVSIIFTEGEGHISRSTHPVLWATHNRIAGATGLVSALCFVSAVNVTISIATGKARLGENPPIRIITSRHCDGGLSRE